MKALTKFWASKEDAILEANDLNTLPLEELLDSLLTHGMCLNEEEEQAQKSDRRRRMALKSKMV